MTEPVAVEGADVVALHTEGRVRQGSPELAHEWDGREWRFANAQNRNRFASDPSRYAPEYDGQCAFAMSLGKTQHGKARHGRVANGRLFLQSNPIAALLFRLLPGRVEAADRRWRDAQRDA